MFRASSLRCVLPPFSHSNCHFVRAFRVVNVVNKTTKEPIKESVEKSINQSVRKSISRERQTSSSVKRITQPKSAKSTESIKPKADVSNVTIVNTLSEAHRVLDILTSEKLRDRYHAIDTEVADIDFGLGNGVHHGYITCITIYVGPDVDFGNGPRLFIDCLDVINPSINQSVDQSVDQSIDRTNREMIEIFRSYLEDRSIRKLFHNHAFDSHQFANQSISVGGFAADTMHMAQLLDPSLHKYTLKVLTKKYLPNDRFKESMKMLGMDPSETLINQRSSTRDTFIDYAAYDAQATWELRKALDVQLSGRLCAALKSAHFASDNEIVSHYVLPHGYGTMLDLYNQVYVPLSEALISIERTGVCIDSIRLQSINQSVDADIQRLDRQFTSWISQYTSNAHLFDWSSYPQRRHLFFGHGTEMFQSVNDKQIQFELTGLGLTPVETTPTGGVSVAASVFPKLSGQVHRAHPVYGPAYRRFSDLTGDPQKGVEACEVIDALCRSKDLLSFADNCVMDLANQIKDGRIHLSFSIVKGHVCIRTADLVHLLANDSYQLRDVFVPSAGNVFMVAQHRHLALRLVAEQSQCSPLLCDLRAGGDIHAVTVQAMYDHVRSSVRDAGVQAEDLTSWLKNSFPIEYRSAMLLDLSHAHGVTDQDVKNAWNMLLNESDALVHEWMRVYISEGAGQSSTTSSNKKSEDDVSQTLALWYRARPEVKTKRQQVLNQRPCVTRLGRTLVIPPFMQGNGIDRTVFNMVIRGSVADTVTMSLLRIHASARFHALGWRLVLQHDGEFVAEGPRNTVEQAQIIMRECMAQPFTGMNDMHVDFAIGDTWHQARQQIAKN